jgi:hypothetical protein
MAAFILGADILALVREKPAFGFTAKARRRCCLLLPRALPTAGQVAGAYGVYSLGDLVGHVVRKAKESWEQIQCSTTC